MSALLSTKGDQMEGLQALSNGVNATIIGAIIGLIGLFLYDLDIERNDEGDD